MSLAFSIVVRAVWIAMRLITNAMVLKYFNCCHQVGLSRGLIRVVVIVEQHSPWKRPSVAGQQ